VRRLRLPLCGARHPRLAAGLAVQAHIEASCAGVARVLAPSALDGPWSSAGPLRTGIRSFGGGRLLAVGNAAAEAHPIVAEGISMAVQSAFLLCELLVSQQAWRLPTAQVDALRHEYESAWRRNFSRRLHVAAALAHLFMRPLGAGAATEALRLLPGLLPLGARWSGKLQPFRAARGFEPTRPLP
jgi:2-polyprenyl-6-methoxyphenol hydroxylase-like FAD-dependent oxidoreductase